MGDLIYSLLYAKILSVRNLLIDGGCGTVKFNWSSANFLLPLIKNQSYLDNVELYNNQIYDYNYGDHPQNIPVVVGTNLTAYHASKFNLIDDHRINDPWLESDTINDAFFQDKRIIVNRTARYHGNIKFYYDFLKYFHPKYLLFVGLEKEYTDFKNAFGANIDYAPTDSSIDLARIINTVPFFIGNQSLCCAIATGLNRTCFIEHCPNAANYFFYRQTIQYF